MPEDSFETPTIFNNKNNGVYPSSEKNETIKCPKCGLYWPKDEYNFCTACGAKLNKEDS